MTHLLVIAHAPLASALRDAALHVFPDAASHVLALDVPTGLNADTGHMAQPLPAPRAERHTLTLLTAKPGLFTAHGRDACGTVWFADWGAPVVALGLLGQDNAAAFEALFARKGIADACQRVPGSRTR